MSNYSVQINWSGKDSLPDSSADKIISGADFQTEFDQIETDMATKADVNGDSTESFAVNNLTVAGTATFTGVPTGPTAAADTNTTQLATTAYVQTELGDLGGNGAGDRTVSTSAPSGGSDGDIWYRY